MLCDVLRLLVRENTGRGRGHTYQLSLLLVDIHLVGVLMFDHARCVHHALQRLDPRGLNERRDAGAARALAGAVDGRGVGGVGLEVALGGEGRRVQERARGAGEHAREGVRREV